MHTSLFNVIIKSLKDDSEDWTATATIISHKSNDIVIKRDYHSGSVKLLSPKGVYLPKSQKDELSEAIYQLHKETVKKSFESKNFYFTEKGKSIILNQDLSIGSASPSKLKGLIINNDFADVIYDLIKKGEYYFPESHQISVKGLHLSLNYIPKTVDSIWLKFEGEKAQEIFDIIERRYTEVILTALEVFPKIEAEATEEPDFSDEPLMPENNKVTSFFAHLFLVLIMTSIYLLISSTTPIVTKGLRPLFENALDNSNKQMDAELSDN